MEIEVLREQLGKKGKNKTISVEWSLSEKGYMLYCEPLGISVSAPTPAECEEDFEEELDMLYKVYAKETDENLTEGARQLKRKILDLV